MAVLYVKETVSVQVEGVVKEETRMKQKEKKKKKEANQDNKEKKEKKKEEKKERQKDTKMDIMLPEGHVPPPMLLHHGGGNINNFPPQLVSYYLQLRAMRCHLPLMCDPHFTLVPLQL